MLANRRTNELGGKVYTYTVPSPISYPFQWFWDSCFHAIILTRLGDLDQAKAEIESLLAWQDKDGFMAHIIFWDTTKMELHPWHWNWLETKPFFSFLPFMPKPRISAEIQSPVIAQAVEQIANVSQDKLWLKKVLPKLALYYDWLEKYRDADQDSLITIIASFESGLDQSPAYDPVLGLNPEKPPTAKEILKRNKQVSLWHSLIGYHPKLILALEKFLVEDVLVNSIYAQGLTSLARLMESCGQIEEAKRFKNRAKKVTAALLAKCWDEKAGFFWNLYSKKEKQAKVKTIIGLMPLIIEDLPKEVAKRLVEEHLLNTNEFFLPFPIPSVARDEKTFSPSGVEKDGSASPLWRGTTWINTNWFIIQGLRQHGYTELANELSQKTIQLVARHGFREYYDPITGEPGPKSAENFGWSALVVDL